VAGRGRGWIAYALAWIAAAAVWALAAASSAHQSPVSTFPFGAMAMGAAALMGVGVLRLTGALHWQERGPRFYAIHAGCLVLYALGYAASFLLFDALRGQSAGALGRLVHSPILGWTLMMGSWLYLIVAGLSYAVRAQQRLLRAVAAESRAQALLRESQLAALRARLNPHFFFNALHAVSALLPDPGAADEALDRLGRLLRYTLDERVTDVLLADEWAFVRDYLELEQLRLGDRLRSRLSAQPAALATRVPILVLQPLVENAIRHGIVQRIQGGTVEVRANLNGQGLELSVADDGPGAPAGEQRSNGTGLASLRQRLDALHGEKASMRIDTAPGAGYRVTLLLPAEAPPGGGT